MAVSIRNVLETHRVEKTKFDKKGDTSNAEPNLAKNRHDLSAALEHDYTIKTAILTYTTVPNPTAVTLEVTVSDKTIRLD